MANLSAKNLVRREQQWRNRQAGSVCAGTEIPAPFWPIHPVDIPDGQTPTGELFSSQIRTPHFVEAAGILLDDDQVAVPVRFASVAALAFECAALGNRYGCRVTLALEEILTRAEGA